MNDEAEPSLREAMAEAIGLLTKFSIPLYVDNERGRPDQFGTGFFVRFRTFNFLVSAAHVLDVARDRRVYFYATPNKRRSLTGKVLTTGHLETRNADHLDVGVMEFTGEPPPPYPEVDKFPMDLSFLKPSYLPRSGKHYALVGFPASKSVVDTVNRAALVCAYAYRSDSIEEGEYRARGFDPETHVLLPLDLRKGLDQDGRPRTFPKPQGMSGSPIVVLYEDMDDTSRVFPVIGVGIEYHKKTKLLVGTDIRFALGAIEEFLRRQGISVKSEAG